MLQSEVDNLLQGEAILIRKHDFTKMENFITKWVKYLHIEEINTD